MGLYDHILGAYTWAEISLHCVLSTYAKHKIVVSGYLANWPIRETGSTNQQEGDIAKKIF